MVILSMQTTDVNQARMNEGDYLGKYHILIANDIHNIIQTM